MSLEDLKKVIPFQFRVQSYSKGKAFASCVAYIDARDVMDTLDSVVGAENWQNDYKEIKGNVYASISINVNGVWVTKWDCGTESNTEAEKGEASDSFKRAAVKWGIGRFLYNIPIQYVKTSEIKTKDNYPKFLDDNGNEVKDLNIYLSGKVSKKMNLENKVHISAPVTQIPEKKPQNLPEEPKQNDQIKSDDVYSPFKIHFKNSIKADSVSMFVKGLRNFAIKEPELMTDFKFLENVLWFASKFNKDNYHFIGQEILKINGELAGNMKFDEIYSKYIPTKKEVAKV